MKKHRADAVTSGRVAMRHARSAPRFPGGTDYGPE